MKKFEAYRTSLEEYLLDIGYLYSGDVISSKLITTSVRNKNTHFSSDVVSNVIKEIYQHSIKSMISKAEEITIHREDFTDVRQLYANLGFTPKYFFFSYNSNYHLYLAGFKKTIIHDTSEYFIPSYFQLQYKMVGGGPEVLSYFSPLIEDNPDECHIYFVDNPIQSFVWILQNMTYSITRGFSSNDHLVKCPVYECNFKAKRIRVIDTQILRERKINQILNDN